MVERDKLREQDQKERRGRKLNLDLPGERPMSYPLDHKNLIQKIGMLAVLCSENLHGVPQI